MEKDFMTIIEEAKKGNQKALETIIKEVQNLVYNLSLKMLLFPSDAKDATQEILIRIITHLSTYKGESKFTTWAYRVATNYLLTIKGKKSKTFAMPFDEYAVMIDSGQRKDVSYTQNEGELLLLEEEVKVSCTQGLLLCLNERSRMIYILGDILEFNSIQGAEILEITPENFRKSLSRSREKVRYFLEKKCGLANPLNPCRCKKKIDFLIQENIIDPIHLRFANHTNRSIELVNQISELEKSTAIYRSVPDFKMSNSFVDKMRRMINSI